MTFIKQSRRKRERGVAMVMAMLALLLLSIIGLAFLSMTLTENSGNSNYKDSQKAYFASRAGLENVRAVLWTNTNFKNQVAALNMPIYPIAAPAVNTGVIYVVNPRAAEIVNPTTGAYVDDELCHEQYPSLGLTTGDVRVPCGLGGPTEMMPPPPAATYQLANLNPGDILGSGTATALPFKWVRIANKQNFMPLSGVMVDGSNPTTATAAQKGEQVCWNGTTEVATVPGNCGGLTPAANPVWVLTSMALTPSNSRRMTQMEVAFTPPLNVPGTISTEAPVTLQGSYQIQSYDNCSCNCTTNAKTGVSSCTARSGFASCYNQAHSIYTANTISVNGSSGSVISNWGNTATTSSLQSQQWPPAGIPNINSLINEFKNGASNVTGPPWNYTCSGTPNFGGTPAVYANCGTQTSQQFGTFPPNLVSSGGADNSGAVQQVTYVPGSVKLTSDANGAGVLIVDGDLNINGGFEFYGLLLVRGKVSFTGGGSQAVNLYGSILSGEDVSATDQSISDTFGGSINFKFDRCALNFTSPPGPPKLLATHELMF